jgi:hypothetical protein
MPRDLKVKVCKRMAYFLEFLSKKKIKSRVDVYMEHLKQVSNKEIYEIEDKDVLEFLIFKDVNDSGRTVVHKENCPHIGTSAIQNCEDQVQCGLRHQAESLRVGIVDKLRKGFEEVGRKGPYSSMDQMGDPTQSILVKQYLTFVRQEQGKSGVFSKGARNMERFKMDRLMENMWWTIRSLKRGIRRLKMKERRGMYAFCYTAIKRLAGAGNVIAPNVIRIPNNMGHAFNCTWDKTLRMGSHCFGFLCVKNTEKWCAHCIIDEWVLEAKTFGLSFNEGLLFPKLDAQGKIKLGLRWVSKDLTETLKRDLERYNLYQGETPHSFRHGGTVDSLKRGRSLEQTMYLAYMKNQKTAEMYSRGLKALLPKGFDWKEAGLETSQTPIDEVDLCVQMQQWKAFM